MAVPSNLVEDVQDATLRVYSWNPKDLELSVEVLDTSHNHRGTVVFEDVRHFCLPSSLEVDAVEGIAGRDLPNDFWDNTALEKDRFEPAQMFFVFSSGAGARYFIVAKSIAYETA